MPASRSFFLTVPEPDPTVSDVDSQLSARAVAQKAARPVLGRDALGQFLDGDRLRDGLPLLRRPPAARLGRGNMESRLLGPNPLGAMHVGDEGLVRVLQSPQKARLLAITGVDAHPSEPHPPGAIQSDAQYAVDSTNRWRLSRWRRRNSATRSFWHFSRSTLIFEIDSRR